MANCLCRFCSVNVYVFCQNIWQSFWTFSKLWIIANANCITLQEILCTAQQTTTKKKIENTQQYASVLWLNKPTWQWIFHSFSKVFNGQMYICGLVRPLTVHIYKWKIFLWLTFLCLLSIRAPTSTLVLLLLCSRLRLSHFQQ